MNPCGDWEGRLLDGALDALEPKESHELEKHLATCPSCPSAYGALRARRAGLDAAVRHLVNGAEPSPGFHARLVRAVEGEAMRPRPFRLWWAAALAGGATLALTVLASREMGSGKRGLGGADSASGSEALLSWRSPTAEFLRSPADSLLRETPLFGGIDALEPPPTNTRGVRNGS
jgi:anti-sigma factor RsiW